MENTWKTVAAYVYLTICLFDFLIMPAAITIINRSFTNEIINEIKAEDRKYALEIIDRISLDNWEPVTIYGGGLVFHLSFGAILTGAAVTDKKWTLTQSAASGSVSVKTEETKSNSEKKDETT